ncbi:MAG: ABC transporter ATP-binding protein [bacterium]
MQNKNPKISIKDLNIYYKNSTSNKLILKNINLDICQGENLSILGCNGSGKTSLLKCLTKNINHNLILQGDILLDDKSIKKYTSKELARKVALLSQNSQLLFEHTIFDTIMMGRYAYNNNFYNNNFNKANNNKIVLDALEVVGLLDHKDSYLSTLSGGQLQRVFIAKIIAQDPDIILLDEPTNHLDIKYQIELINFFKDWSKQYNKTIIGVFHDVNLAMLLTPSTILLHDKAIKFNGNINDIINTDLLNIVYDTDIKSYMLDSLKKWCN